MSELCRETVSLRPDAKEYIAEYWEDRSESFARLRKRELHSEKMGRWKEEILSRLPRGKKLKILDVGCGTGFFAILLSRCGHQVTGIDLTAGMVEGAGRLAEAENSFARFQVMDAERLLFEQESFDAVVARNVTWNLPHPETAYREWLRVLKIGGVLLNYDGEYAKNHHTQSLPGQNAHEGVSDKLLERCHGIYHMLDISLADRPEWDKRVLETLCGGTCEIDPAVGERIYREQDSFYTPVPVFGIRAVKGRATAKSKAETERMDAGNA